jgi:excinuclease UvrABC nuclease subunit
MSEESGLIRFLKGDVLLYVEAALNLKQKFLKLSSLREDDYAIGELFRTADILLVEPTRSALEALKQVKVILESDRPEFNQSVNIWKGYVYLAINPAEYPFVKITEYTEEDWFYIGPFRSRFFLVDVIELISKLLKLPYCEGKTGPCEKLENEQCRGWCLLIKSEIQLESDKKTEQPNLEKLDALLKEAFVHPDNGLLEMLQNEKQKYFDNLEFAKADLLTDHIEFLKRYKDWLVFLYKCKLINVENEDLTIKNGQLNRFKIGKQEHYCPHIEIPYRKNEILALNKNLVDEAWIIYQEKL